MSRRLWNLLWGVVIAACLVGFAHFTQIAVFRQQHFAPGAEHPWDFAAEGCLALALAALAGFLLMRVEPTRPRAWRKTAHRARKSAKPMHRSGYNKGK